MKRELKTINVGKDSYNYTQITYKRRYEDTVIEYPATLFVRLPYEQVKDKLDDNLIKYEITEQMTGIKEAVKYVTIIGTQTKDYFHKQHIIFEGDNKIIKSVFTTELMFLTRLMTFIEKYVELKDHVKIENSLSYKEDAKYKEYLKDYLEPKSEDEVDLTYKGRRFRIGEAFYIHGFEKIVDNLKDFDMKDFIKKHKPLLKVKVNGTTGDLYGVDVELLKDEGESYTNLDYENHVNNTNYTLEEQVNEWMSDVKVKRESSREYYREMYTKDLSETLYLIVTTSELNQILKIESENITVRDHYKK